MSYTYPYPRPAVTADVLLFSRGELDVEVLLIERGHPPFAGRWALPGGFVDLDEPLERAARRELAEETALEVGPLAQLGAYGDPGRDPRGHVVTVAFIGLVEAAAHPPRAGSDAARSAWFPVSALPPLAFDHDRIIADGLERLRGMGTGAGTGA